MNEDSEDIYKKALIEILISSTEYRDIWRTDDGLSAGVILDGNFDGTALATAIKKLLDEGVIKAGRSLGGVTGQE